MNHANDNHTGLRFLSVCSGIEAASVARLHRHSLARQSQLAGRTTLQSSRQQLGSAQVRMARSAHPETDASRQRQSGDRHCKRRLN